MLPFQGDSGYMATERKNQFLYLTLACFVGLIAIFVVDGYLGVYDTVSVTTGETEQEIESDFWLRDDIYWSAGSSWSEKVFFTYEIDNRLFSSYTADVEVSVWQSQEKVKDIISRQISVASFEKEQLEWSLDTANIFPGDEPPERGFQYTIVIKRRELERRILWHINPEPYPVKPAPARP